MELARERYWKQMSESIMLKYLVFHIRVCERYYNIFYFKFSHGFFQPINLIDN